MDELMPPLAADDWARTSDDAQFCVLGAPIDITCMQDMKARIMDWSQDSRSRYVCVADVHSIMRTRTDPAHAAALAGADAVTPDGTPLSWVGRLKGFRVSRVCGPDLMAALCAVPPSSGLRHFFYGGRPEVLEALVAHLTGQFPQLQVVGALSPPFWDLGPRDWADDIDVINRSGANIVWIGLGCPKQERWMALNLGRIRGAVLIGVGAAFDFHAGSVSRAPGWMRNNGLEWLHRLLSEPRRLWKRYLVTAPQFVALAAADILSFHLRPAREEG